MTCANCGSAVKLATGIYYECRDIRSMVMVCASAFKCQYWRKREERQ